MNKFNRTGFHPADILIPKNADMQKWSVVACDQYTSEPEYWEDVKNIVGDSPSTLNMIFPEIYLEGADYKHRIEMINKTMGQYINEELFECINDSYVYVEREVEGGKIRKGLVGKIDLEAYDYTKESKALVRATEGTVLDRIPPRVRIRVDAPLEFPHIMLLIDDPGDMVFSAISKSEKLYDFDLMKDSGHITGYKVSNCENIAEALNHLMDGQGDNPLLYAVGDGNHSLATAKECWNTIKSGLDEDQLAGHPARFALVELVNIHDSSLEFEPIHRVIFDCDVNNLISEFKEYYPAATESYTAGAQKIKCITKASSFDMYVTDSLSKLAVGTLQNFLDEYLKKNQGRVDYIHGDDVTARLAEESDSNIGFILPPMAKSELFEAVKCDGALPRKTFSMGHAFEKRFYLEGRKIKG